MKHISRITALILAVALLCSGCGSSVSPEKYSTTAAATYGDQTTYLDEANFWLRMNQWSTESYTAVLYYYYYGITNIWPIASGVRTQTFEQTLKETVMAEILQTYVLLDHSGEYSAELTEEDNRKIDQTIEDIRDYYADEFFKLAGIADGEAGDKQMRAYIEKRVKAFKVAYGVMQAADVTINEDECKSFRIGYILVPEPSSSSASTESTEDASSATISGKDLADVILNALQGGQSFNDTKSKWPDLTANEATFAYSDTSSASIFYSEGKDMKTGESKISYVSGTGWYVLTCLSDDDAEAAAAKRDSLTAAEQEKAFNEVYKGWQDAAKSFKVTSAFKNLTVEPSYVAKTTTAEPTTEAPSTEAPSTADPGPEATTSSEAESSLADK